MITFISDVHLDNFPKWGGPETGGVNLRARHILRALELVVGSIDDGPLVILGDFFNRCQPPPALIAQAQNLLEQVYGDVFLLLGNHDQESSAYGHNALSPLSPVATIVETPMVRDRDGLRMVLVPFKPGPAKEWLPEQLDSVLALHKKRNDGQPTALCVHMGLSDSSSPYYLDQTAGSMNVHDLAKLCKAFAISHVFAGDWHRHQSWNIDGVHLMQVGSLCPNRFPPNYEHGDRGPCVTWTGDRAYVEDIPGPRFYKLRWSQIKKMLEDGGRWTPYEDANPAYLKLTYRTDQADEAREWAKSLQVELGLLADGGRIGGIEFDVDRGIERAKAKTASFDARQASSLDEAIQLFCKSMPIDENVNRDAVVAHVRRMLG